MGTASDPGAFQLSTLVLIGLVHPCGALTRIVVMGLVAGVARLFLFHPVVPQRFGKLSTLNHSEVSHGWYKEQAKQTEQ